MQIEHTLSIFIVMHLVSTCRFLASSFFFYIFGRINSCFQNATLKPTNRKIKKMWNEERDGRNKTK